MTTPTIGGTISITKSWPMAACLPNAEQRKPSLRFSLRLAVFVKKTAPVRARVCAVIVEDSHRRKGTSATPCTAVSNYFTGSRTNKFPFMDRLSWRPLSFQTKRAMSACGRFYSKSRRPPPSAQLSNPMGAPLESILRVGMRKIFLQQYRVEERA